MNENLNNIRLYVAEAADTVRGIANAPDNTYSTALVSVLEKLDLAHRLLLVEMSVI